MKRIVWLGSTFFGLLLLWSIGWIGASWYLRQTILGFADADGTTTPRLVCNDLTVGGFPFRFDVTCTSANVTSGDITVGMPELRATTLVYHPTHVLAFGRSPLTLTDAFSGSSNEIRFSDLTLSASLEGLRIGRISLVGNALDWSDTTLDREELASAGHLEAHLLDIPEQYDPARGLAALALYLTATAITAPGLDVKAGTAEIQAEINGLPDDVRAYVEPDLIRRWQANGGALKLVSANGTDGADSVSGAGTLSLDSSARLNGQVQVTSKGLAERLGGLIPAPLQGVILGSQTADGSHAQTIAAKSGALFAGFVPLWVVPPLF